MRENRPSGSEGGVALIPPSLPLSNASRPRRRWADMEGCVPPRPLARVVPGPPIESLPSGRGGTRPSKSMARRTNPTKAARSPQGRDGFHAVLRRGFLARRSLGCSLDCDGGPGPQRMPSSPRKSGRLWKAAVAWQVSGRSEALRQRQQAGAVQALREFGGAVQGRGSAGSLVARSCYGTRAGVEPGPPISLHGGCEQGCWPWSPSLK
jgi:hypothetical protein